MKTTARIAWGLCFASLVIMEALIFGAAVREGNQMAATTPAGFTDSRGLTSTTEESWRRCMKHVFIQGHRVKANHPSAEPGSPREIFERCMLKLEATL